MKLTKFLMLAAVIGIFSACRDNPETHQIKPGGYTGENKSAHQNSPGHSAATGEQTSEHGAESNGNTADHDNVNNAKTAVVVNAATGEKASGPDKKSRVEVEADKH